MKLCVSCVVLAAACSGSSPSPAARVAKAGRAERLSIGGLEAYALEDGHLVVPNDGKLLAVGREPREVADLLAAAGLPRDTIRLDITCLLVKVGARVILFDTGIGQLPGADAGRLLASLALAGVQPVAVTDVFISHAHGDHVGGLVTKAGALAFPAATVHLAAAEWAALRADGDADAVALVAAMAPKVVPFEPDVQVLPVVKAIATPGHTVGHTSYEVGAPDGEKLFYLGDVAHHAVISVQRPAWSIAVDADRTSAESLRQRMLARFAAEDTHVFARHFPYPGVGRLAAQGDGVVWKPQ
ncbi:MAG: MBL fold metallo-hydrolase [Deltaproteobacteria bacterium]|nr:MBL fold metallo-hydrolase [Deltaproteobacteria bacterium]